ncbi:MAG: cytochrome P450, CYP711 clan [Monoraphidium minutum]|nr:MAG: cytochrome P450, CYP711 clan [Monoraphidium minutum]
MDPDDLAAVVLAVAALVTAALWTANRWKLRRIPGPFAPPVIGNLPGVIKYGFHVYLDMCRRRYGRIFKIYLGSAPFIVIADAEAGRKVNYRFTERAIGPQLSSEKSGRDTEALLGLVAAKGDEWRALRMAWQPAFASGSLAAYSGLMDGCALKLVDQLAAAAAEGAAVDIWRALGTMTMGVVGTTAFGIDLHTQDDPHSNAGAEGHRLVSASQRVFSSSSIVTGSRYQPLLLMFPRAARGVQWLAARLPDRSLIELTKARGVIRDTSMGLIHNWRAARAPAGAPAGAGTAPADAALAADGAPAARHVADATLEELQGEPPPLLVPSAPAAAPAPGGAADGSDDTAPAGDARRKAAAAAAPPAKAKAPAGAAAAPAAAEGDAPRRGGAADVEPGSFLGLLLRARDRESGAARFSDATISAQASTFILAGYETTANALSYAVYCIASNPRERLLAEVTHADLGAFTYSEAVIKEALRLYPPAILTSRVITRDEGAVIAPGVTLPKGTNVFTAPYCYQRDEAYWPRPLEFAPERFLPEGSALAPTTDSAWTPFGAGPRMCIGWRFALNEAKIALVRLHQRFTFDLQPGQVPLQLRQGLTLSPANGVWVTPVARGAPPPPVAAA